MIKEKQTIESFRSFSWVTSKIHGSFVSELLRASWHSGGGGEGGGNIFNISKRFYGLLFFNHDILVPGKIFIFHPFQRPRKN